MDNNMPHSLKKVNKVSSPWPTTSHQTMA